MSAKCWWSWAVRGQHPTSHPHPAQGSSLLPAWCHSSWLSPKHGLKITIVFLLLRVRAPVFLAWLFPERESCCFNSQPGSFPAANRNSFPRDSRAQGYRTANTTPRKAGEPLAAYYFRMGGDYKLCLHLLPCEALVLQHCRCFPSRNSVRRGEDEKRAGKHKRRSVLENDPPPPPPPLGKYPPPLQVVCLHLQWHFLTEHCCPTRRLAGILSLQSSTEKEGAALAQAEPPAHAAGLSAAPTEQCQPLSTANPDRITAGTCRGQLRAGAPKPGSAESCHRDTDGHITHEQCPAGAPQHVLQPCLGRYQLLGCS